MSLNIRRKNSALLGLVFLIGAGAPALAQERSEVREVLNRAETQAARRAVEDLLGSIGITRANAQTLPQPTAESSRSASPAGSSTQPPAATGGSGSAPVVVAQGAPPPASSASGSAPVPTVSAAPAAPPSADGQPAAQAPVPPSPATTASGSPANPTMIVRVPASPTPPAAQGVGLGDTPAPVAVAAPAEGRVTTASAPAVAHGPVQSATLVVRSGSRPTSAILVRGPVRIAPPEWCPPGRY